MNQVVFGSLTVRISDSDHDELPSEDDLMMLALEGGAEDFQAEKIAM